ncbi:hypothetical protein MHPYR_50114 [uncultured Mycobacterium sp.]|uniref:Uncharacterized protein n=1 Tax=uncultured Mycobacterium sp. TaxID=171292 RepID=A0A1Y5PGU0_9MYCO|nr:hypothetical protein MHPYR_50114 [uncultured Mycobacterium sp.]
MTMPRTDVRRFNLATVYPGTELNPNRRSRQQAEPQAASQRPQGISAECLFAPYRCSHDAET